MRGCPELHYVIQVIGGDSNNFRKKILIRGIYTNED